MTLQAWPDGERALCDLLASLGTTGTETPATLESETPYIRVTRTGGSDDHRATDTGTFSIDVFATGATTAKAAAEQVRQTLLTGLPAQTDHGQLDWAFTDVGPQLLPPSDTDNLRLAVASYKISMRRVPQ